MFFKKKIDTFQQGMEPVDALETWVVKWISIDLEYPYCGQGSLHRDRTEYQCFADEQIAKNFATTIGNAYKLLHITGYDVSIKKQ